MPNGNYVIFLNPKDIIPLFLKTTTEINFKYLRISEIKRLLDFQSQYFGEKFQSQVILENLKYELDMLLIAV